MFDQLLAVIASRLVAGVYVCVKTPLVFGSDSETDMGMA